MDSGLPNFDRAQAGDDRPLGMVSIADHLPMPSLVGNEFALVDPLGHFGLNGPGEHLLSSLSENLGQHIVRGWKGRAGCGNLTHGGVLLGLMVVKKPNSNPSTPPFSTPSIHDF